QKARDDHQTEKRVWEEQLGTHARTAEETMQAQLLEQLEAQQELRMAHLQQMAAKRMMQAGLTKCWTSWLDVYLERQASMRMLAAAAGRLARPALAACLVAWRTDWQQAQAAAIEAAYELRAREKDEAQAKALAMQAEAEREKRIAHVQQKAAKRMMQAGLTKGWQTWLDMYLEHQRQKRMLAAAAGRLARPALTAALTHWREDFVEEQRQALAEGQALLKRDQVNKEARHADELARLQAELAAVLASKEEELRLQAEQLGGDILSKAQEHAKELAAQAEAAHEARVAHLQQAAAKRMMQAGLTKGWQSWLDLYLERQASMRMLAAAAGRLARPALTAALTHWRDDWQEEQRAALEEGQRLIRAEAEGHSAAQQAEIDALRAEMAAALAEKEEQLRKLSEEFGVQLLSKEQESSKALAAQAEAEAEKRVAHLQQAAARRMMQAGLTRGWQSWLDVYLERQRSMRMLAAAAGRLARPALTAALTHWRADWQEEQQRMLEEGQELLLAEQARRDEKSHAELEVLRAELQKARDDHQTEKRVWEEQLGTHARTA
ncbi:MAG: hypothetical protein ACKVJH_10250, partial [Flavobacteriales bacterium]